MLRLKLIHASKRGLWWCLSASVHWIITCPVDDMGPVWGHAITWTTLISRFMGPTWGPSGANRTQVGPMLAPQPPRTANSCKAISYKVCCHCREECFTVPSHWCVLYWTGQGTIKIILVEIVHQSLCITFFVVNILTCTYHSNISLNKIFQLKFNSLAPGTCGSDFRSVISECILWIKFMSTSCEIALRWMPWSTFYDKSILIQVIAWCRQTINWSNVDPDLHHHMVSIGHNELVPFLINWSPIYFGPT